MKALRISPTVPGFDQDPTNTTIDALMAGLDIAAELHPFIKSMLLFIPLFIDTDTTNILTIVEQLLSLCSKLHMDCRWCDGKMINAYTLSITR